MAPAFTIPSFQTTCAQLMATLEPGRSSVLYTFPFCGHHHRLQTLLEHVPQALSKRAIVIQPTLVLDESVAEIVRSIKTDALVFLPQSELLLKPGKQFWLEKIIGCLKQSQAMLVWLAELMPFQLSYLPPQVLSTLLTQQFFLPQLSLDETEAFIHYLEAKFAASVSVSAQDIFEETAGNTWLTKEIVRQEVQFGHGLKQSIASPAYQAKASLIFQALPKVAQEGLRSMRQKQVPSHPQVIEQLVQLGIIRSSTTLPGYVARLAVATATHTLEIKDDTLYLNQVKVTHSFSLEQQRLLRFLLDKRGQVVKRAQLAEVLWSEGDYTDWALDRAMFRLKQKLTSLGLPPHYIATLRNIGYKLA